MQQMQANIKANSVRHVQRKMSEEGVRSPHPASPHPGSPHPGTPQQPSLPGTPQSHPGTPQAHSGIPAQYNNQGMYSTFSYGPQSTQQLKQQQAEESKPPQFSVQQAKQKLQGSDQPAAQFGRFDASPFTAVSPPAEKPKKKPTPKKKEEKKAPAKKRAPKRKAEQGVADPRSLHIHAPITFPLEKRTKKVPQRKLSSEKSPLCPYDQQVQSPVYNAMSPVMPTQQTTNMYPNMPTLHQPYSQDMKPQQPQQQFMPPNQQQQRMQHYQQWGDFQQQPMQYASQQQQQSYNAPLYNQQQFAQQQFQQQRSYSPPSTEDIDVNQFLNMPIKNKEGDPT